MAIMVSSKDLSGGELLFFFWMSICLKWYNDEFFNVILLYSIAIDFQSTFKLAELLGKDGIEHSIKSFNSRDGIAGLGENPFVRLSSCLHK